MSDINVPPQLLAVSLMFSITTAAAQHTTRCLTLQNVQWQRNFSISSLGFGKVMTSINNCFSAYSRSVQWERKSAFLRRCLYNTDLARKNDENRFSNPVSLFFTVQLPFLPPTLLTFYFLTVKSRGICPNKQDQRSPPAAPHVNRWTGQHSLGGNIFPKYIS